MVSDQPDGILRTGCAGVGVGAMIALLLGKPCHGETRRIDTPKECLRIVIDVIPERKHCPAGQCAGISPRRETVLIYQRDHSPGLPDGAVVYRRRGYEPQPEDEELGRMTFG
jgi:hypothetical protein